MSLLNTEDHYGSIAKFFHWLTAILIIGLIVVGFIMDNITAKALKMEIYNLHKLTGLIVLILTVLRLSWRWFNITPPLPLKTPPWEYWLEKLVKFSLYFCLFALPITGWVFVTTAGYFPHIGNLQFIAPGIQKDKELAKLFANIHVTLAWTLLVLLALHFLGVLKHHYIHKDNILKRMLP